VRLIRRPAKWGRILLLHHLCEGRPWPPLSFSPSWCCLPWCGCASCFSGADPVTGLPLTRRHRASATTPPHPLRGAPRRHSVTPVHPPPLLTRQLSRPPHRASSCRGAAGRSPPHAIAAPTRPVAAVGGGPRGLPWLLATSPFVPGPPAAGADQRHGRGQAGAAVYACDSRWAARAGLEPARRAHGAGPPVATAPSAGVGSGAGRSGETRARGGCEQAKRVKRGLANPFRGQRSSCFTLHRRIGRSLATFAARWRDTTWSRHLQDPAPQSRSTAFPPLKKCRIPLKKVLPHADKSPCSIWTVRRTV
jgi:hypothetical protein